MASRGLGDSAALPLDGMGGPRDTLRDRLRYFRFIGLNRNFVVVLLYNGARPDPFIRGLQLNAAPAAMGRESKMRELKMILSLILCFAWATTALGFESTWTDQFGETTYTITGPDEAVVGNDFQVTLTVSDPLYPEAMIAAPWNFQVDAVVHDNGFGVFLAAGTWTEVYTFNYAAVGAHDFLFNAQDMGHGGGAHNWEWMEIGGRTTILPEDVPVAAVSWGELKSNY